MAKMNQRMKEIFEMPQSVVLATASKDGVPNAVPVNMKKLLDDETILIADNFLKKTGNNIEINPEVAVTFWDKAEGYQAKGTASIETSGQLFEETAEWVAGVAKKMNMPLKAKGAVKIKIQDIFLVSPGPKAGEKAV